MRNEEQTVDAAEIARFAKHAESWWDIDGPLKTLHDINPARLEWIEQYVTLQGLHVLDIGCGGGVLSEGLAKKGAIVTGLDVEEGALQTARAHAKKEQLDIHYVCEPVECFESPQFDVVTCLEMLEHVDNPERVIHSAARLLKPGGTLFLSTLNRTAKAYALAIVAAEYVLSLLPRQTHTFERFIRPSELAKTVREAGLSPVGMTGLAYNPFSRKALLQSEEIQVNYLLAAQKPD